MGIKRGGQPSIEVAHGKNLLDMGAESIWGWSTPAGKERVKARINWITRECGLGPGIKVLECGCGIGVFTQYLAKTGADVTAVDISGDLLNEARKQCVAEDITFIKTNLEDPVELPDNNYDVICGISILHHLELSKALLALKSKLKPGSRFAFSEPNLLNPINKYLVFTDNLEERRKKGVTSTEMAFYPTELVNAFENAGFKVESIMHRDFLHPSVPNSLIPLVKIIQSVAEKTPCLQKWSGSLWISGYSS